MELFEKALIKQNSHSNYINTSTEMSSTLNIKYIVKHPWQIKMLYTIAPLYKNRHTY